MKWDSCKSYLSVQDIDAVLIYLTIHRGFCIVISSTWYWPQFWNYWHCFHWNGIAIIPILYNSCVVLILVLSLNLNGKQLPIPFSALFKLHQDIAIFAIRFNFFTFFFKSLLNIQQHCAKLKIILLAIQKYLLKKELIFYFNLTFKFFNQMIHKEAE